MILLTNNELLKNLANPYAGIGESVRFSTVDHGLIVALGVNKYTSSYPVGSNVPVIGDVIVETSDSGVKPASYKLSVLNPSQIEVYSLSPSTFGAQLTLANFDTSGLPAGTYTAKVSLLVKGQNLMAGRQFQLTP